MGGSDVKRLREQLGHSQRVLCGLAAKEDVFMSQATLSLMEADKVPVPTWFAKWLSAKVYGKYKRIQDMPVKLLAEAIRNRAEVNDGMES